MLQQSDGDLLDLADLFSKLQVSDSPKSKLNDFSNKKKHFQTDFFLAMGDPETENMFSTSDCSKNKFTDHSDQKDMNFTLATSDLKCVNVLSSRDCPENKCADYPNKQNTGTNELSPPKGDTNLKKKTDAEFKKESIKYFAVAVPLGVDHPGEGSLIYRDLKDALQAIKKYKGARFKEFTNKDDALKYSAESLEKIEKKSVVDECLKYRTSQELCQIRKAIERGDETYFTRQVWTYPRTLVGDADIPTVMQHGARFNALHVAAKCNKPLICQLILDILENPKFSELLYSEELPSMRSKRMYQIRDLYLNTGTQKTGDTPLHYAAKFGCIDCCKILLSHPQCDQEKRNVDGLTARETICSRFNSISPSLKEEMESVFNEGLVYVPVLRFIDDITPAIIGKPCSCRDIDGCASFLVAEDDPKLSLKAFAGPMSPKMAQQFYKALKNPSSPKVSPFTPEEQGIISKIKFTDPEKGIERIGRHLAEEMNIDWREFFPGLNVFTNFSTDEGLNILENHLEKLQHRASLSVVMATLEPAEQSISLVHQYPSHVNPLGHRVNVYYSTFNNIKKEDEFFTPPTSPEFITPPSSPRGSPVSYIKDKPVFLKGSTFTKLDADVFLAIQDYEIDIDKYPNICRWKQIVTSEMQIQSLGSESFSQQCHLTPLKSRFQEKKERFVSRKILF